jgi:predicted Zn-dependent protease
MFGMARGWPRRSTSMPSERTAAAVRARYSDGQSAKSWTCELRLGAGGLEIDLGDNSEELVWPYSALVSHTAVSSGAGETIIERRDAPGAQVHVRDAAFIKRLVRLAPQLSTSGMRRRWLVPLLAATGAIVGAAALAWHLDFKPDRAIAKLLPDSIRQSLGRNVVAQFTAKRRACTAASGQQALDALKARLLQGIPGASLYNVTVVDIPIINAFATPGGQMMITNKLIQAAKTPDEVAGILAHEIGHGIERHPEAGVIRVMGLSFVLELISGGNTGGLASLGLLYLQNGYVRRDEASADQQALQLLRRAKISQNGLADFFARSAKRRCKSGKSNCTNASHVAETGLDLFDLLRTHPYPKTRLKVIRKTKPYASTPALTDKQWNALRTICQRD